MNDKLTIFVLPSELIHHICSFFTSYLEYYYFRITCKHLKNYTPNPNFFYRFLFQKRIELDTLGFVNGNEFCQKLKDTNSIVAGSYPLQVLLGEYYHSDIDIYFHYIDNKINNDNQCFQRPLEQWLKSLNDDKAYKNWFLCHDEIYKKTLPHPISYTSNLYLKPIFNSNEVSDFNFIGVNQNEYNIFDCLLNSFDFSFVKICFDGEIFLVKNIEACLNKQGTLDKTINNITDLNLVINRYNKYKERNFKFNKNEMTTLINIRENTSLAAALRSELKKFEHSTHVPIKRIKRIISQISPDF